MSSEVRNVVVAGFMGTGKSTISVLIAQQLQRPLLDMDALIEERTGWTIPQIFAARGEAFFRAIEKGLALELSLRHDAVIATGGGALLDPVSREALMQTGWVICLMAKPETLAERLAYNRQRPLAAHWRELLASRRAHYAALPNPIWTDDRTPQQVSEEVIGLWNASR